MSHRFALVSFFALGRAHSCLRAGKPPSRANWLLQRKGSHDRFSRAGRSCRRKTRRDPVCRARPNPYPWAASAGPSPPGRVAYAAALAALDATNDIGLLAAPGSSTFADGSKIADALLAQAARRRRFAVLNPPPGLTPAQLPAFRRRFDSPDGALFFPWLTDSAGLFLPPSGFICGTLARVERERGVFRSAAGETLRGAAGLTAEIGTAEMDTLNAAGVALLRRLAGRGIVLWGARTPSSGADWKYINIRRYASFLENSLVAGTQWAVFKPNDETLWSAVRGAVGDFLLTQWRAGALQGEKPEAAFFVRCDRTTMTQDDLHNGQLVVMIGFALLRPAEFVIIRIGHGTAC